MMDPNPGRMSARHQEHGGRFQPQRDFGRGRGARDGGDRGFGQDSEGGGDWRSGRDSAPGGGDRGLRQDSRGGGDRGYGRGTQSGGDWGLRRDSRGGGDRGYGRGTQSGGDWGLRRDSRGGGDRGFGRGGDRGTRGRGSDRERSRGQRQETQDKEAAPQVRHVDLQDIIFHSFLPKQIPDILQPNLIDIESMMLQYSCESLSEAVVNASQEGEFSEVLLQIKKLLETWKTVQPRFQSESDEDRFVQSLKQELLQMKDDDTVPVYVRKQNSTILMTKLDEQRIHIATFRPMLPSSMVMSSVGSVAVKFPETCDVIYNNHLLMSDPFLRHLHELSVEDFEISLPITKKGETNYTDYRDVADPFLVSDWIVGALVPASSQKTTCKEIFQPMVSKKLCDEVTLQMSSRAIPFRRSGMWTSIKVTLALKLLMTLKQEKDARIVYKIIMLRMLTYICQQYTIQCHSIDWDLTSQMLAKIGQRVSKLEEMTHRKADFTPLLFQKIENFKAQSLEHIHSIIKPIQQQLTGLWRKAASSHPVIKPIVRSCEEFQKDLDHEIHWLDDHIKKRNKEAKLKKKTEQVQLQNYQKAEFALEKSPDMSRCLNVKRFFTPECILKHKHAFNYAYSEIDEINQRIWLFDTETFIKKFVYSTENIKALPEIVLAFIKIAVPVYIKDKDPVCCSQMILVILQAIKIFDAVACEKFPLLADYKSGIDSKHFENLVLPHQDDINLLEDILSHFESRNESANLPSLIATNEVNEDSFAVQFGVSSELINKVRATILNDTDIAIREKFQQLDQVREECKTLQRKFDKLGPCKGNLEFQHDNKAGTRARKALTCKRCIITRDLKWKRNSVTVYERPLPPEEHLQFAVVCELKFPKEIAILRDLLSFLNFEMLGQQIFNGDQKRPLEENPKSIQVMEWREYLKKKGKEDEYKSGPRNGLSTVNLASPTIAASGTSHTKLYNPDVLENPNERFIVENDLDCIYYHEKPLWYPTNKNVKEFCAFQLDSTANSEMYSNLQWTVGSIAHTQNSVIARKFSEQCHQQLNMDEFVAFGTLRAGNRIQLRNLLRSIHDLALSLQREPVLALILQTIWQVGPRDEDGIRDSHVDFKCTEFCVKFLNILEELVASREINYSEPLIILTAILITIRIMELNEEEECRDCCYLFLKKCRSTVNEWVRKIEEKIANSDEEIADNMATFLKTKLLEATICSVFSYNICNESLIPSVIRNKEDMANWFHNLARLHQLTEEEQVHQSLSIFSKSLLNSARNVALKLNLESKMESIDLLISEGLHLFACEKWSKAKDCTGGPWIAHEEQNHFVLATYQEEDAGSSVKTKHFLHFDFILGTFLVNGFSQSTLPPGMMEHPLYQRFFKDSSFRIQRYSTCARTIDTFHGKYYEFEVVVVKTAKSSSKSSSKLQPILIVREIQEDGNLLEMLDHDMFRGILGNPFIENYTHWLDIKKKLVYLRRLPVADSDYNLLPEFILYRAETTDETNNSIWKLHDERLKKEIMSINSEGFRLISGTLSRMECKEEVIIHRDATSKVVTARLPRYRLNFNLNGEVLHSVEYGDFRVSSNQNLGTLIGLQQGLLMEVGSNPDKFSKRILIVPHGQLTTRQIQHQTTVVDLNKLRAPSFFVYEYDTVLKKLKADKSKAAWLYLATLHACTACSLPDPFTEITGTEAAVGILQSGYVFSSSPYDKESLTTLEIIKNLSPKRCYYAHRINLFSKSTKGNEKMETTIWPADNGCLIPTIAAYDGYAFIVNSLVEFSQRLSTLHPQITLPKGLVKRKEGDEVESEKLQLRAYLRHLSSYNQAAHVKPDYMKKSITDLIGTTGRAVECKLRNKENSTTSDEFYLGELLSISQTRLVNTFQKLGRQSRNSCNLGSFLLTPDSVSSLHSSKIDCPRLKDLFHLDLRANWLQLYLQALLSKTQQQKQAFTIILSAMAYRGAPLEQVMNLHHISILSNSVAFPPIPESIHAKNAVEESDCHIVPILNSFNEMTIQNILEAHSIPLEIVDGDSMEIDSDDHARKLDAHNEHLKVEAARLSSKMREQWPCEKLSSFTEIFKGTTVFKCEHALKDINLELEFWYRNLQFCEFVKAVEQKINEVLEERFSNIQEEQSLYDQYQFGEFSEACLQAHVVPDQPKTLNLCESLKNLENEDKFKLANEVFESGRLPQIEEEELLSHVAHRELYVSNIKSLMEDISRHLKGSVVNEIMEISGIIPRTTPSLLLQYLLDQQELAQRTSPLVTYVGAMAVLWSHLKRLNRCIALELKGDSALPELRKELDNVGHVNWSPKEIPEWLLLELELDVMIRPVQVDVARQMMNMPNEKNGVMQLNMGEGKTTVIVPMCCCLLAKQDESLCRVTVLTSIFKTNFGILSFAIGGLINRRVYTFPSRRDMNIDLNCVEKLMETYEECLRVQGVVITLPEYRLSFRLLAYDKILKDEIELGTKLLETENWLRFYCRDLMDESDELFNVKYQLVYTTGLQISLDGDEIRWTACQKILKCIQLISTSLFEKYGCSIMEFNSNDHQKNPEQFIMLRLLSGSEEFLNDFYETLAEELFKDLKLRGYRKQVIKQFMTEENVEMNTHTLALAYFQDEPDLLNKILLYSAYLRRGVLFLALSKRWRVEYGVDPRGPRRMAVPFRAKDVAAERTEFGHPDLAIVLTHLSYYYSGLSDSQLQECFDIIKNKLEAETIYNGWLQQIPVEKVPKFLRHYEALNLHDVIQRLALFNMLRRHKLLIDFWLSHKVFPRESKQFPGKIVMTAGDLCYERNRYSVSGFSGTNDSSELLPLPISQQDLTVLEDTNANLEKTLLQLEHGNHEGLPMGVTCVNILERMKRDKLRILIDAGALMLECDNEQVAELWLKGDTDPSLEAVVYFSKDNELLVKHRRAAGDSKGTHIPDVSLELSPYRDRLERCGVFLDDQHTRGTDLKFPNGFTAIVTVGTRMRRDKLMQSCMRMRKLGNGHSVRFYISHEAQNKIMDLKLATMDVEMSESDSETGEPTAKKPNNGTIIRTEDILNWVKQNTKEYNQDGLLYWALSARNYAQKLAAEDNFNFPLESTPLHSTVTKSASRYKILASQCVDDEVTSLLDMYGNFAKKELLVELIPHWFEIAKKKLQSHNLEDAALPLRVLAVFQSTCEAVVRRCEELVPEKKVFGAESMDEDQEKELTREKETEIEEERENQRPSKADDIQPWLHENVKMTVLQTGDVNVKSGIIRISDIFTSTSFGDSVQPDHWGSNVFATRDFASVIKCHGRSNSKTDSYLRPIEYFVTCKDSSGGIKVLILSNFEVDELIPEIRKGRSAVQLHMFSRRKFPYQDLLLNVAELQLPIGGTPHILPEDCEQIAPLLLASGSLYFKNTKEQKAVAQFLALVPLPRTKEQEKAVEDGMITETGFLLPAHREANWEHFQIDPNSFPADPTGMMKKILHCRHSIVSHASHVMHLLSEGECAINEDYSARQHQGGIDSLFTKYCSIVTEK